jgi:pilus assembly protein CpaC
MAPLAGAPQRQAILGPVVACAAEQEKLPAPKDDKAKEEPPKDAKEPRRLPLLGDPETLGSTPKPNAKDLADYARYVESLVDPRNTLDLIVGRTRLLVLKEVPSRVQVGDPAIAEASILGTRQISLLGRRAGTTVLTLFFKSGDDKERVLSYLVRVIPDPEAKLRLERAYQALEAEVNKAFPDSSVQLRLIGDKLAVCGQAKDIAEGTQILRVVRSNAPAEQSNVVPVNNVNVEVRPEPGAPATPGLSDFLQAGGPNIINLLRVPGEQQVMLKVVVAEVNRSAARSIGVDFTITNRTGIAFSQRTGLIEFGGGSALTQGNGGGTGTGIGGVGAGIGGLLTNNLPVNLDNGKVRFAINALRTLNYARSLAEPNLTAMNGQTATFQAGGQFPVPVVTSSFGGSGLQGVNFVPFGIQLTFTPFITDCDRIRLNVAAEVSTRDLSTGTNVNNSAVSGLNTRNFQTVVELREGQTLAVAGLIQNNLGSQSDRVPLLGDLPILGRFWGFDRMQNAEQELIVLITPELVHPMNPKEVPPVPGSDLFEPSDLEFYALGRFESRRNYDYRTPVRNSLGRMRAYKNMEDTYIFGPSGYSEVPVFAVPAPTPGKH